MVEIEGTETLLKGVTALALESEPSRDLCNWIVEQKNLNVTVLAGRPRNRIRRARKPWAWLSAEDLEELSWCVFITTAHIYSDHLENSSALIGLSNVTDLSIHLGGEKFDESDIELFQRAILNLADGKLKRLKVFVVESAGELARGIFKWPHAELAVTIEVVPTRARPKRRP